MSNYNDNSWSDKFSWIITVIAMVLVAILSIGLLCALFIQPQEGEPEAEPKDGAVISETAEHGVSLMSAKIAPAAYAANGVSVLADTAYTLTASVEPDYAGEKTFDWSIKFEDGSSSWANGKSVTDYVTVTPSSDGADTATVECKQAFGERILVTCTSRDYTGLSATCTVDYAQRITGMDVTLEGSRTGNVAIPEGEEVSIDFTYYGGTSSYNVYTLTATRPIRTSTPLRRRRLAKSPSSRAQARTTAVPILTITVRAVPWARTAIPAWTKSRTPSARRFPLITTCLSRTTSAMSRARS